MIITRGSNNHFVRFKMGWSKGEKLNIIWENKDNKTLCFYLKWRLVDNKYFRLRHESVPRQTWGIPEKEGWQSVPTLFCYFERYIWRLSPPLPCICGICGHFPFSRDVSQLERRKWSPIRGKSEGHADQSEDSFPSPRPKFWWAMKTGHEREREFKIGVSTTYYIFCILMKKSS